MHAQLALLHSHNSANVIDVRGSQVHNKLGKDTAKLCCLIQAGCMVCRAASNCSRVKKRLRNVTRPEPVFTPDTPSAAHSWSRRSLAALPSSCEQGAAAAAAAIRGGGREHKKQQLEYKQRMVHLRVAQPVPAQQLHCQEALCKLARCGMILRASRLTPPSQGTCRLTRALPFKQVAAQSHTYGRQPLAPTICAYAYREAAHTAG